MNKPPDHSRRYSAFISYRHADNTQEGRRWAEWLHRGLERYVVPPDLIGTPNLRGEPIRDSLYPIFRDEDELPANADLATGIRAALEVSDHLIVICSPRSAVSPWVRKEVREFKELGRSDRILAIIIAGEPNADDPAKAREGIMRDEECFCEELRFGAVCEDGTIDWTIRTEPLAADLRPVGTRAEGFVTAEAYREYLALNSSLTPDKIATRTEAYRQQLDHALFKTIAGLLAVPLGRLKDRDAAHRTTLAEAEATRLRRFIVAITGLAIFALGLAVFGLWQMFVARNAELIAQEQIVEASRKAWGTANDAIGQGDNAKGFAHLAEAVRYESHLPAQRKEPQLHAFAATTLLRSPLIPIPLFENPPHHDSGVNCASFSADGKRIVTGSYDHTARIWDAATGKAVGSPMHHASKVELAVFSPNGRFVVTVSDDNSSRLWNSTTGDPIGAPLHHDKKVKHASFSPDSKRVVTRK
ncbi:MAG: toll/interleukin-1 receptor domain-containing protein [Roseimicrobium sp.]